VWEEQAVWEERVVLAGTDPRSFRQMPVAATGNTIRNIAVALRIETAVPRTGLAARRAATRWLTVKLAPSNSSADRAVICPATALRELA